MRNDSLCLLMPWTNLRWDSVVMFCISSGLHGQPFHPHGSRWHGTQAHWKWDFSLEASNVSKPKVFTILCDDGLVSWHLGVPSVWEQHLNVCFMTYIVDPEMSTGPVILLFLWDHFHSDVSVRYGFFCEWPVMVTFHLRWKEDNMFKQTGWGRREVCAHLGQTKVLASEELYMIIVKMENEGRRIVCDVQCTLDPW